MQGQVCGKLFVVCLRPRSLRDGKEDLHGSWCGQHAHIGHCLNDMVYRKLIQSLSWRKCMVAVSHEELTKLCAIYKNFELAVRVKSIPLFSSF